jgi:Peptidase family M28
MTKLTDGPTGGWLSFGALMTLALALAWFATRTPAPAPASAPLDRFAAGRAMADVRLMASKPHPVESAADAQVRDQLRQRLAQLGLASEAQHVEGLTPWKARPGAKPHAVDNVIAVLHGRDPKLPALLLMSHYDSVPKSPGAADDMAGVASELEIARLMQHRGPPARDVIFLFTDGEEAGLLGAQAFLAHPLFAHAGYVINMETRGGGGRALMFQTGADNGETAKLFAARAISPSSNSLTAFLYKTMPNDTDFSVTLSRGLPGMNFAFIGRPGLYHSPEATPEHLEQGALQSLGEQAWRVGEAIAYAPALPAKAPDAVWSSLFGHWVIVYSPAVGWGLVGVAATLLGLGVLALKAQKRLFVGSIGGGVLRTLAATAGAMVLMAGVGMLATAGDGQRAIYYHGLRHTAEIEAAALCALTAAILLAFNLRRGDSGARNRALGGLLVVLAVTVALQRLAPAAAVTTAWPLLAGAFAFALRAQSTRWWAKLGVSLIAIIGLSYVLEVGHAMAEGIGAVLAAAMAVMTPLAVATVGPKVEFRRPEHAVNLAYGLLAATLILALIARFGA